MAEIRWTPEAVANLAEIVDFIARDLPVHAERFAMSVLKQIDQLAAFPNIGRAALGADPQQRELRYKGYTIGIAFMKVS